MTDACRKLANAYEVMKDPEKRREYDVTWSATWPARSTKQETEQRQAQAAEPKRDKTTEGNTTKEKEADRRRERLRDLNVTKSRYDKHVFDVEQIVKKLAADLQHLQDQDDEELRRKQEKNGWFASITSLFGGKAKETEKTEQERETQRLQRLASKRIKQHQWNQDDMKLQKLKKELQAVKDQITAETKREVQEARLEAMKRQEQLRQEQEAKRRDEEQRFREIRAKRAELQARQRKEAEARSAKEAQAAREACAAREAQAAKEVRAAREAHPPSITCRHDKFWPKLEGSYRCDRCRTLQRQFAFRCPGCSMTACARCRRALKGQGGTSNHARRSSYGNGNHDKNSHDTGFEDYVDHGYGSYYDDY